MIRTWIPTLLLNAIVAVPAMAGTATFDTIALSGDAAPGTPAGVSYGSFGNPVLNDAGQIAFNAGLAGASVGVDNDRGIFSEAAGSPGMPGLVAREGDPAPGTAAGITYGTIFDVPVLDDAGQAAFRGFVFGPGVDTTNDSGVFSEA
ncbi:MAG: choice-of-anchor tandem repeat NxxGxxAF-containing protein, partial [Planctomycetota bacterium]